MENNSKLLYRYYAYDAKGHNIDNLKNRKICFNNISRFNDPFEGVGVYAGDETEKEKKYWEDIGCDVPQLINKRLSEELKESILFKYRVACFTEEYNNPLMWAHYTDAHKGFCVGYAFTDIQEVSSNLEKIKYTINTPCVEGNDLKQITHNIVYSKAIDWAYEQEWRAIYKLGNNDVDWITQEEFLEKSDSGNTLYYYQGIHENCEYLKSGGIVLKECEPKVIYVGLNTFPSNRCELYRVAKDLEIEIYDMEQKYGEYTLQARR